MGGAAGKFNSKTPDLGFMYDQSTVDQINRSSFIFETIILELAIGQLWRVRQKSTKEPFALKIFDKRT